MALLTISQALNPVKLSLLSGTVPALVGWHGIGKTQLARQIADSLGWKFYNIDVNLLKEGEIGGLPVTSESSAALDELPMFLTRLVKTVDKMEKNEDTINKITSTLKNKIGEIKAAEDRKIVTKYAIFHVLADIKKYCDENPEAHVLLFLDEFNRAENVVMQEVMNLILNRNINGFKLPENVHLLLAMNPSGNFEEFRDYKNADYMTNDMDKAQLDRFRLFFIDGDVTAWTDWAMAIINEETAETRIHPDIVEFIANNPDVLNMPESQADVSPSSRSWERLSDTYKMWKTMKGFTAADLFNIARGDLGSTVAVQFTQFLQDNANPLIKPEEIFIAEKVKQGNKNVTVYKELSEDQIKRIRGGNTYPRMMMVVKNCIRYVVQNKHNKAMAERLVDVICLLPKDLMTMVMMEIFHNQRKLHNILCDFDKYLDTFDALDKLID